MMAHIGVEEKTFRQGRLLLPLLLLEPPTTPPGTTGCKQNKVLNTSKISTGMVQKWPMVQKTLPTNSTNVNQPL